MDQSEGTVFVVDADALARQHLAALVFAQGWACEMFDSAGHFLERFDVGRSGCLLVELDGPRSLELHEQLAARGSLLPVIFRSSQPEVELIVRAMKAGAWTVLDKSASWQTVEETIQQALERNQRLRWQQGQCEALRSRVARLDSRERQVWHLVVGDQPNKSIARALGVSQRTVDRIRATVFAKLGVQSAVQAARLAMELEHPPASHGSAGTLHGHTAHALAPMGYPRASQWPTLQAEADARLASPLYSSHQSASP